MSHGLTCNLSHTLFSNDVFARGLLFTLKLSIQTASWHLGRQVTRFFNMSYKKKYIVSEIIVVQKIIPSFKQCDSSQHLYTYVKVQEVEFDFNNDPLCFSNHNMKVMTKQKVYMLPTCMIILSANYSHSTFTSISVFSLL